MHGASYVPRIAVDGDARGLCLISETVAALQEKDLSCNRIQAVGKGTVHEDLSLDYEWYEIR